MKILERIAQVLAGAPEWIALIILPALLLPAALAVALIGKRKIYPFAALFLGAMGVVLMSCMAELKYVLLYAGLFAALTAVFSLLLLIPSPLPKAQKARAARGSKQDRMYEKFRAELTERPYADGDRFPPKECCFEEDAMPVEESVHLEHVTALLKKLRACPKLTASDRLETDELDRRLKSLSGKPMNAEDRRALNDVLATVLKLTAKYQL